MAKPSANSGRVPRNGCKWRGVATERCIRNMRQSQLKDGTPGRLNRGRISLKRNCLSGVCEVNILPEKFRSGD